MNNNSGMVSCAVGCWLVAALGGALAAVLLGLLGGWTFMQAVFAGIVIAAVAGALVSWIMCKPLPPIGARKDAQSADADTKAATARAEAEARSAQAAAAAATATVAASTDAPAAKPAPAAKATAPKAAASEAAAPKAAAAPAETPAPKPKAAPKPKPKAKAEPAPAPAEAAPTGPGKKPETLSAARDGGPDNLKEIKGVGPKLEALLHSMGFYHFDQIAAWGADEVAWVDQNLQGFKGRVTRDTWVDQAKILAAGGDTEFSKKVDKGDVY